MFRPRLAADLGRSVLRSFGGLRSCLLLLKTKPSSEVSSPDGLAEVDPDGGQCPMQGRYRVRAILQQNSLVKLDVRAAG